MCPLSRVGLGVQTTREINVALLGKHIWSLQHDPHMLWVQLLSNKYLKGNSIFHCSSKPGVSYSWASIVKATNILQLGFRFWVGNGALSLWFDCLCLQGSFYKLVDFVHISDTCGNQRYLQQWVEELELTYHSSGSSCEGHNQ